MKVRQLVGIVSILLLAVAARAEIRPADLPDFVRDRQKLIGQNLSSQLTNAAQIAEQMIHAYDAQHPADIQLDILSVKQLQRLVKERTNDLAPRLILLTRDLKDDQDCNEWFATLKEAYVLCTNEELRVTSLAVAVMSPFGLERQKFGRSMLAELSQWLKKLLSQDPTPSIKDKIKYLQLCVALGNEAYSDASVLAKGTPFRTMVPLWMMSKGKWEMALREVRTLKQLFDLDSEEKSTLDFFESFLTGITEKKSQTNDSADLHS